MTTDCKELFSIFLKIGGTFKCDFETNEGILFDIRCKNLNEIHDKIHIFENHHSFYPLYNKLIKINYLKNEKNEKKPPFIYDNKQPNISSMLITINFDRDGMY
jgi:hypothetical protein